MERLYVIEIYRESNGKYKFTLEDFEEKLDDFDRIIEGHGYSDEAIAASEALKMMVVKALRRKLDSLEKQFMEDTDRIYGEFLGHDDM